MLESKVLNFNPPIISLWNERRGRMCVESHVATGHLGSICYNSFRWKAARLFKNMPKNTSARPEVRGTADVGWRSLFPLPLNPPRTHS